MRHVVIEGPPVSEPVGGELLKQAKNQGVLGILL
jgi:hypothetical protein